jgi:hypothetical protein
MTNIKLLYIMLMVIIIVLNCVIPISAAEPSKQNSQNETIPAPITDLSKAVTFSHKLDNICNLASPKYNPTCQNVPSPLDHLNSMNAKNVVTLSDYATDDFGVGFPYSSSGSDYYYTRTNFSSTMCLPNTQNAALLLTLKGDHTCSLELMTCYYNVNGYTQKCVAVFDWTKPSGQNWVVQFNPLDNYIDLWGYWTGELIHDPTGHTWTAIIYNCTTAQWENLWTAAEYQVNQYGWNIWEAKNFPHNPWPDCGQVWEVGDFRYYDNGWITMGDYQNGGQGVPQSQISSNCSYAFDWIIIIIGNFQ